MYAGDDWASLDQQTKDDLSVIGGSKFSGMFSHLDTLFPSRGVGYPRRLTAFSDLEGKTRIIAILDYFSQTTLRPLHNWLFRLLSRIPQDCTFDQGKFIPLSKGWSEFYSCDLTNATDRFPIEYIGSVLKGCLPENYVEA